jgi:hypothetical protein
LQSLTLQPAITACTGPLKANQIMKNYPAHLANFARFFYMKHWQGFSPPGDEPFMPVADVERFKAEIAKAKSYVEFGSGGSTVYANQLGIRAVSVESDGHYARVVASRLDGSHVQQIICDLGLSGEWGMPVFPNTHKASRYVTAPWGTNAFPEFILVDGRYRVACALESARRAYLAGSTAVLMFDDYVTRPFYHDVEKILGVPEICERAAIFGIGQHFVHEAAIQPWLSDPK